MRHTSVAISLSIVSCAWMLFASAASAATAPVPMILHRTAPFGLLDSDGDGIPDEWETTIYLTDPADADTDHDKHDDLTEILQKFNPKGAGVYVPGDFDTDGLDDRLELAFGSDPTKLDTDGDGFHDGHEVDGGFSPTSTSATLMEKSILITLSTQELQMRLGGAALETFKVSTGKASTPTPKGTFKIFYKHPKAWSRMASLWMPDFMQFTKQGAGIHELPEWPSGKKEGAAHLGTPVSHGCVRLGVGPAKTLYDWSPIGTPVVVVR